MKTGKKLFAVVIFIALPAFLIYIFYSANRDVIVTKQFFSMVPLSDYQREKGKLIHI